MKYLIIKNKKLYKLFFKFELKRLQYKCIMLNRNLPNYIRQQAFVSINKMNKNLSYVSIKQRCLITNNGRSVLNHFNSESGNNVSFLKKSVTELHALSANFVIVVELIGLFLIHIKNLRL